MVIPVGMGTDRLVCMVEGMGMGTSTGMGLSMEELRTLRWLDRLR